MLGHAVKRIAFLACGALCVTTLFVAAQQPPGTPPAAPGRAGGRGGRGAPPVQAKPEELAQIAGKAAEIEGLVKQLKAKKADAALVGDVDVFAKTGRILIEFPELFGTQAAIDHSMA